MKPIGLSLLLQLVIGNETGKWAQDPFQISVNVDLVVLNATVRDQTGRLVPDLRAKDFGVQEDGVAQTLRLFRREDLAVTVGLVIDHSGSMNRKLENVIAAALKFLELSNPADQLFVVNFNESVSFGLPAAMPFTGLADPLKTAILEAPTTGKTALYDAVSMALKRVHLGGRERDVLLVVSDGADNASTLSLEELLKTAGQSSAMIYTIGIFAPDDPDRNPEVLKRLAHATGGEAFFPKDLEHLPAVCERIAAEIRSQYTLGYISSNPGRAGHYRRIRVAAKSEAYEKLSVRTRAGYITEEKK
jgi:Ca-activated chloride channel family protein